VNFNLKRIGARSLPAVASANVLLEPHIHRVRAFGTTAAPPGVNQQPRGQWRHRRRFSRSLHTAL